jgi:hypothetical protein
MLHNLPIKRSLASALRSLATLAAFWQQHDVTDFEDELEEISEPVFHRAHLVGVSLTEAEHRAVRDAAVGRGLDEATLIREWVREKIGH